MNGAQIFDQQAQMLGFVVHGLKRLGCEGRHIIPRPPAYILRSRKDTLCTAGFRYRSCHMERSASKREHGLEHISPALFASLRLAASLKSGILPYHTSIAHEKPVHYFAALAQ